MPNDFVRATEWTNVGVSYGSTPFLIDGIDVWKHKWLTDRQPREAVVTDPIHGQRFRSAINRIETNGRTIAFAAGEFSNGVWGFYLPNQNRSVEKPSAGQQPVAVPFSTRLLPFVPICSAVFEVPWVILVVLSQMGTPENGQPHRATDPYWPQLFNLACLAPAAVGLVIGLVAAAGTPRKGRFAWTMLILGCLACGGFVYGFGRHLL